MEVAEKIVKDLVTVIDQLIEKRLSEKTQEKPKPVAPVNLPLKDVPEYVRRYGLSISTSTLYKMTMQNKGIPFFKFGRSILFPVSGIDKYIENKLKTEDAIKNIAASARKKIKN